MEKDGEIPVSYTHLDVYKRQHRTNMEVLSADLPLQQAVDFILSEGSNTRYPVYGEDIDDIIGVLHLRDAMTYAGKPENKERPLKDIPGLLREASFIPVILVIVMCHPKLAVLLPGNRNRLSSCGKETAFGGMSIDVQIFCRGIKTGLAILTNHVFRRNGSVASLMGIPVLIAVIKAVCLVIDKAGFIHVVARL